MTTHLPLTPTKTTFCHAEIPLDLWRDDDTQLVFFVDGNSKITAGNGTYADPKPNAFSLPAASVSDLSCPGSTAVCRASCYVRGLAKHAPDLYARYVQNQHTLETVFALGPGFADHAAAVLAAWITENCPGGFRWHVSGDVMGVEHAVWITDVAQRAPTVNMWLYTRTLEAVGYLVGEPNLVINVSADRENIAAARAVADLYPDVRLCYLCDDGVVPDLPPGSVIFPDYALRGRDLAEPTSAPWWQGLTHEQRAMVCGVDFFGQSEPMRCGVCTKCMT